jgi:hypothetical protein
MIAGPELVPSNSAAIVTPLYRQYWQALAANDYEQALEFAVKKLQDPTQ